MLVWVITVGTVIGTVYGQSRIIGGENTSISNHGYQVSLQTSRGDHFCGGFLISKTWVVTAAHCVNPSTIRTHWIRAGSTFYNKGGQTVQVQKAIVHPNYCRSTINNDIALLKLAKPVTDTIAKIANLPSQNLNIPDGTNLYVTGWGVTRLNGDIPEHLQGVQIPTVNRAVCRNKYQYVREKITDNMFCAGFVNIGGKDACSGDSGGPAAKNGTVYGIVSWGVNCADPRYPGVYTQVSRYRKWIKQKSGI